MTEPQLNALNLNLDGIAHVLRDRLLSVPTYQRSYSWGPEEVDAFWGDLRSAMLNSAPDYFMGTIVFTPVPGRKAVIDGQQRLATVAILLAVFRDVLREAKDETRAAVIEQTYLATRDLRTGGLNPRFQLNSEDSTFFGEEVIGTSSTAQVQFPSNLRIRKAKSQVRSLVDSDLAAASGNWPGRISDWVDFLEERVKVITIDVSSEADAFMVFETLNDRGLDLTVADLLKNYLLSLGQARTGDEIEKAWLHVISAFDVESQGDDTTTTFIRHYWSSLHGPVRERELYQSLKRRIRSQVQASELVSALSESAPSYAALLDAKHERWQELEVPQDLVDTLLGLRLEQPRPLLLAAMDVLKGAELSRLLTAVVAWSVRGLIVGGIGGGTTERYYAQAAQAVRKLKATSPKQVASILEPIIEADGIFVNSFSERRVNQERIALYYLSAFEQQARAVTDPSVVSRELTKGARVIHVLPRRASAKDWPAFKDEDLSRFALRLGNQILVDDVVTARQTWQAKRSILSESSFLTTVMLDDVKRWTPSEIDKRQRVLAHAAPDIWPTHL